MEDKSPLPTDSPPAERTAQALRELHDRAQNSIAAQRARMEQLEAQLTQQLDSIADTLATQISTQDSQADQAEQSMQEVDQLRTDLEAKRAAWDAERDQWQAEHMQLIAARDEQASELEKKRVDLAELEAVLQLAEAKLQEEQIELAAREQACQDSDVALRATQEALETERASFEATSQALTAERDAAVAQLESVTSSSQSQDCELAVQLASAKQQLVEERANWERERTSLEEQRRLLANERDNLATGLDAARSELTAAREDPAAAAERDELRQKLDLALEDLQRLRGRVGELEEDLARRPAPDDAESVELVQLRAERDALAQRVAELEKRPAATEDSDASQERADFQRRFELAVEDVRDLKKKNAQLESQLAAAAAKTAPAPTSGGGSNWEAMKLQMLANLEGESDDGGQERAEERATIESTIRITDEALAHKDQEIAELKQQLAEGANTPPHEAGAVQQLIDADAVIIEHRVRIAEVEKEMNDKLRAAEIELSVERAKLAREKVQLAEWQAEIDAHRPPQEPGNPSETRSPKRRWLSKLGLGEDKDE